MSQVELFIISTRKCTKKNNVTDGVIYYFYQKVHEEKQRHCLSIEMVDVFLKQTK